ncbi:MAG TPA: Calx-beta domain-containing protein [Iamia sp.]|nr:Calx-beta domain-containing protein [Iamia sp.]
MSTPTRRLTAALALALGLALIPTAAGAANGFTTPTVPPRPPVGPGGFTVPLPDLTVEAYDATEADGQVEGRLTLSSPLTVDLSVSVSPQLIDVNEWDLACPSPGGGGCGWTFDVDIPAGATTADFDLSVYDDDGPEPAERYGFEAIVWDEDIVDVGPAAEALLYDGSGLELGFVTSNPEAPEGDPGSDGTLDLVVEANQAVPEPVTFRVHTAIVGESADPGADYDPIDVVVELPAGETDVTVEVALAGDQLDESDELFFADVSDPSHGEIAFDGGTAVARILDDDGPVVTWKRPGSYQSPSRSALSAARTA